MTTTLSVAQAVSRQSAGITTDSLLRPGLRLLVRLGKFAFGVFEGLDMFAAPFLNEPLVEVRCILGELAHDGPDRLRLRGDLATPPLTLDTFAGEVRPSEAGDHETTREDLGKDVASLVTKYDEAVADVRNAGH